MHKSETSAFSLQATLAEISEADITQPPVRKQKKYEDSETVLCTLPDELARLWRVREIYRDQVDDIVTKISDVMTVHFAEYDSPEGPTEASREAHQAKLKDLFGQMEMPGLKYSLYNHMFWIHARIACEEARDISTLGVRENDQLVGRDNDLRGDQESPFEGLRRQIEQKTISLEVVPLLEAMIATLKGKCDDPTCKNCHSENGK